MVKCTFPNIFGQSYVTPSLRSEDCKVADSKGDLQHTKSLFSHFSGYSTHTVQYMNVVIKLNFKIINIV